ncbi:hypothetical protein PBI_MINILON_43 [Mycobacterium phage MiniLon]|nr:hypothetical protein PBI_MINILON_43 [Mycobacterium phage MiniLon]
MPDRRLQARAMGESDCLAYGCNPRSSHQAGAVETHGTTGIVLKGRGRVRV